MEPSAAMGCVNICNLTSNLPVIPYQKLTDLYYLSRGGFGTVFKAQHSDWRTTVAIKCLKLDSPVGERYIFLHHGVDSTTVGHADTLLEG